MTLMTMYEKHKIGPDVEKKEIIKQLWMLKL